MANSAPKLLFLVTEDWYFCSHRLPVARAARDAGFAVTVATRVRAHGERIRAEGFALVPLRWKRRGDGLLGHLRALGEIARLYRRERPDLVYHVALKPVLFGGVAARLAFAPRGAPGGAPAVISAVMGLGSGLGGTAGGWRKKILGRTLRFAAAGRVVVQNPEDRVALVSLGVNERKIALIRGSGVDTAHFVALPEPPGPGVTAALVGRMLKSKGVLDAVAAIRALRASGRSVDLLLAGAPDPDSRDSLSEAELGALAGEPGIAWLGHVDDVRQVWARAAIALLPSRYGEGVPKALLEAASCARPIVASDRPGCREVVVPGETGLLAGDSADALAAVLAALVDDPGLRRRMGEQARARVVAEFAEEIIAEQTLALLRSALDEARRGGRGDA